MRAWKVRKRVHHLVESGWKDVPRVIRRAVDVAEDASGLASGIVDRVRAMRPSVELPAHTRIISIGGVSWGGDGKTPVTRYLARRLRDRSKHVTVVSRGFGGKSKPGLVPAGGLLNRRQDVRRYGDEAVMITGTLPGIDVWAGHRRACIIKAARTEPDFIIVDDGLSLRGVVKHLEIALLSSERMIHRRLPAGPLRRPITDTRDADIVGIRAPDATDLPGDIDERIAELLAGASVTDHPWFLFRLYPVEQGGGMKVLLASGIANSDRFETAATEAGFDILGAIWYPDHHMPSKKDFAELAAMANRRGADAILVTGKDAPRFPEILDGVPVRVMTTRVKILRNADVIEGALDELEARR